ncbi:MAG: methyltransferase domain-containing protein [Verrucomicrobiales bacterium]
MSRSFHVVVRNLPVWLDWQKLVGPGDWTRDETPEHRLIVSAHLTREQAADLAARLRGVGIGGRLLNTEISPPLNRKEIRKASTEEARRYRQGSPGFTRRGTHLDPEGKVSLTPETLARELGGRAAGLRVVDAFAGAGGNAIGFARAGCRVIAIELNPTRLAMARHNAKLYGVERRITFLAGDARNLVPEQKADLLFLDPPWGSRYDKERVTLDHLPPCGEVMTAGSRFAKIWLKLPPSFDPQTLPDFQPEAFFGVGAGDQRRVKFLLLQKR